MRYPAVIATLLLLGSCLAPAGAQMRLFVSPKGNDSAAGTQAAPLATLEGARDAIRRRKVSGPLPKGGVTVVIEGGEYAAAQPFVLEARDSGTSDAPVTYAAPVGETVRITGGRRIPAEAFLPVERSEAARLDPGVRDRVVRADLKALKIADVGKLPVRFNSSALLPELFFDDRRQTLAQWPDDGWTTIEKIVATGSIPRNGDKGTETGVFEYSGDRPSRWSLDDGVWLQGYWAYDWAIETIRVRSIDTVARRITLDAPHTYGVRMGNKAPRRYRAVNVLAELDSPGEYYIDRRANALFFYPPGNLAHARVTLSTTPTLVRMSDVSHVRLRGLTLEESRADAVTVTGGSDVRIEGCTVRNSGGTAILIDGGTNHVVTSCDIYDTGARGLVLTGGDRRTLTPSGHRAINNHIHHFSRMQRTHCPGLEMNGVGVYAAHNLIHDSPHYAVYASGNDHLFEYNIVHDACLETDDAGAFYMGRNPSDRGVVLRYNFFHHTGTERSLGNNAIYFDDGDCGSTVFGNVFYRAGDPGPGTMGSVFSHGGHDNVVDNNVFIECKRAIGSTPWNDQRWYDMIRGELWQTRLLKEVDVTKPPFTTRYPQLVGLLDPPTKPRMNVAVRNVAVMCGDLIYGNYRQQDNYVTDSDPGFVDIARGDFRLKPDSEVFKKVPGFQPIPFEKMGLVRDDLRPNPLKEPWSYPAPKQLPPLPTRTWSPQPVVVPKGPAPVYHATRTTVPVTIDGDIQAAEWDGADRKKGIVLKQRVTGALTQTPGYAWVRFTDTDLLVAIDVRVPPESDLTGEQWGVSNAVEIAARRAGSAATHPLRVLRGYPGGMFETLQVAPGQQVILPYPIPGAAYAAKIVEKGRWTVECRIPFAALGIDPARDRKLAFNVTFRRAQDNTWIMWEGTRLHSHDVDNAGLVELVGETL